MTVVVLEVAGWCDMPKVTLIVDDVDQLNFLEQELVRSNIKHNVEVRATNFGLPKPYLMVDGVPLDLFRALKWIEVQSNEC